MKADSWQGVSVDVVKMLGCKLSSMNKPRIAAAKVVRIDISAILYGFVDPMAAAIRKARGWRNFDTLGQTITGRVNKQSREFSASNRYGSTALPRISGGEK